MIRSFTCVCMLLAGASGLYLYQEKHRTALLDREIARTIRTTVATRAQTEQLRADWAVLNEPDRLRGLADHFLALQSLQPTQWVQWGQWHDLAGRLPAPVAHAPAGGGPDSAGTDDDVVADAAPSAGSGAPAPVSPTAGAATHVAPAAGASALLAAATLPAPVSPRGSAGAPPKAAMVSVATPFTPVPVPLSMATATIDAHAAAVHVADAAHAATHRAGRPEHAPDTAHTHDVAPHELAAHEAHDPMVREATARTVGRPIMAPVLSAMAGPMRSYASAPVVSQATAMMPLSRAGANGAAYGGAIVSAIGGMRGSLPAPTPIAAATPYGADR